ncbi:aminotransferase class I/II-fold pyridoxal phosphate-dependent enzyme [Clostridium sporogenes]
MLTGTRIGFSVINEEIVKNLDKVRPAFNINSVAESVAISTLKHSDFLKEIYDLNLKVKNYL